MQKVKARCTQCGKKIKAKSMKELLAEVKAHESEHEGQISFFIEEDHFGDILKDEG